MPIGDNPRKGAVRKRTQLKTKAAEKFKGVGRERWWPSLFVIGLAIAVALLIGFSVWAIAV